MKNGLLKKFISILLVFVCGLACFSNFACSSGDDDEEQIDTNKTQLYIANQNYGFGKAWLDSAKVKFESAFEDYSFEPGKKGVQILGDFEGTSYSNLDLISTCKTLGMDIIFGENTQYFDFIDNNVMLDISDVITNPLTDVTTIMKENGLGEVENGSIADKLLPAYKNYLNVSGNYYALPNYECTYWINYNKELFENKKWYFKSNGELGGKSTDSGLSAGPDGQTGTYDDGLPATYEQFYKLCKAMGSSIIPICWAGGETDYHNVYLSELHAAIEGDESMIGYTFNGTATRLIKVENGVGVFNADGIPVLESKAIDATNGYEIYRQSGRYWALKFFEDLIENGYCSNSSTTQKAVKCQTSFIFSRDKKNDEAKNIAMMIEGNYWTNEADGKFTAHSQMSTYGGKSTAQFSVMPWPRPNSSYDDNKNTIMVGANDLCFIYKNIPENRKKAAKMFLQFLFTDEMLIDYAKIVGTPRGCAVNYSEELLNSLPVYTRDSLKYMSESNIVIPASQSSIYKNHMSDFKFYTNGTASLLDTDIKYPVSYLSANSNKNVNTSQALFNGMLNKYNAGFWSKY